MELVVNSSKIICIEEDLDVEPCYGHNPSILVKIKHLQHQHMSWTIKPLTGV